MHEQPRRARAARITGAWDLAYRRVGDAAWRELDMEFPSEAEAISAAEHVAAEFPDIEFRAVPPERN